MLRNRVGVLTALRSEVYIIRTLIRTFFNKTHESQAMKPAVEHLLLME